MHLMHPQQCGGTLMLRWIDGFMQLMLDYNFICLHLLTKT